MSYDFGHRANEDDRPEPLCLNCGEYHPPGPCPGVGPDKSPPEPDRPGWSYRQVAEPSAN